VPLVLEWLCEVCVYFLESYWDEIMDDFDFILYREKGFPELTAKYGDFFQSDSRFLS